MTTTNNELELRTSVVLDILVDLHDRQADLHDQCEDMKNSGRGSDMILRKRLEAVTLDEDIARFNSRYDELCAQRREASRSKRSATV